MNQSEIIALWVEKLEQYVKAVDRINDKRIKARPPNSMISIFIEQKTLEGFAAFLRQDGKDQPHIDKELQEWFEGKVEKPDFIDYGDQPGESQ